MYDCWHDRFGQDVLGQESSRTCGRNHQAPPQRIVWSYSQWQPIYTELQKIIPWIEFVHEIPTDLEEDWFFNSDINNLLIIDDQMQESSNNNQIMNLFTRGSHHKSLSLCYLVQNVTRILMAASCEQ